MGTPQTKTFQPQRIQLTAAKLFPTRIIPRAVRLTSNKFHRTMSSFNNLTYSETEQAEINQWLTTSDRLKSTAGTNDQKALLDTLNAHLASRTTLLGAKPSKADIALYESLAPQVFSWTAEQRTGEHGHPNIVRHLDFVQNAPVFALAVGADKKVKVDPEEILYVKPPVDAKAEKERLKKEKAAAAAAAAGGETVLADRTNGKKDKKDKSVGEKVADKVSEVKEAVVGAVKGDGSAPEQQQKKMEKKEKAPKPQKAPAVAAPSLIDLRVGHILKAIKHPEADSLYVSTIAMGDKAGTDDTSEYEGQVVRT